MAQQCATLRRGGINRDVDSTRDGAPIERMPGKRASMIAPRTAATTKRRASPCVSLGKKCEILAAATYLVAAGLRRIPVSSITCRPIPRANATDRAAPWTGQEHLKPRSKPETRDLGRPCRLEVSNAVMNQAYRDQSHQDHTEVKKSLAFHDRFLSAGFIPTPAQGGSVPTGQAHRKAGRAPSGWAHPGRAAFSALHPAEQHPVIVPLELSIGRDVEDHRPPERTRRLSAPSGQSMRPHRRRHL